MNEIWKDWRETKKICAKKKVVLFGRSADWVLRTIRRLDDVEIAYIVDNNPAFTDTEYCGLKVYHPSKLDEEDRKNLLIIITAGPYESVVEELLHRDFTAGFHFICSAEFKDWGRLQELRKMKRNVIISCADYTEEGKKRYSKMGGGLYEFNTETHEMERKIQGVFRQIIRVKDKIFAIEYEKNQILVLSNDFKVLNSFQLKKMNACGIDYSENMNAILIANASTDIITVHDAESFKTICEIPFSDKAGEESEGDHHINDICVTGDHMYVSYFSKSGNWRRGVYDGGVDEFNLKDLSKKSNTAVSGLWMPHSVKFFENSLTYLDSMSGELRNEIHRVLGKFPGFARGLEYDGEYYYIGQSESMYVSRLYGVSNNIMCNAGFYIFDPDTKASRFYSTPFIMNVHDLLVM